VQQGWQQATQQRTPNRSQLQHFDHHLNCTPLPQQQHQQQQSTSSPPQVQQQPQQQSPFTQLAWSLLDDITDLPQHESEEVNAYASSNSARDGPAKAQLIIIASREAVISNRRLLQLMLSHDFFGGGSNIDHATRDLLRQLIVAARKGMYVDDYPSYDALYIYMPPLQLFGVTPLQTDSNHLLVNQGNRLPDQFNVIQFGNSPIPPLVDEKKAPFSTKLSYGTTLSCFWRVLPASAQWAVDKRPPQQVTTQTKFLHEVTAIACYIVYTRHSGYVGRDDIGQAASDLGIDAGDSEKQQRIIHATRTALVMLHACDAGGHTSSVQTPMLQAVHTALNSAIHLAQSQQQQQQQPGCSNNCGVKLAFS
jgi:hypothetical protein